MSRKTRGQRCPVSERFGEEDGGQRCPVSERFGEEDSGPEVADE